MVNETSSTHHTVAVTGVHRLRVAGHSLLKGTKACVKSATFRVGGHDWAMEYSPDGEKKEPDDDQPGNVVSALFLRLVSAAVKGEVVTSLSFCLEDPTSTSTTAGVNEKGGTAKFSAKSQALGYPKYMSKTDLAASGCIKDDCLVIKCTVSVITSKLTNGHGEDEDDAVTVPPSDLDNHLRRLLESGVAADITIKIGWFREFKAHRCVLAARSPVFRALLCGSMMERKRNSIRVKDMDASVFDVLLRYMYDDSMPEFMEEETMTQDAANMTKHLLVAADRYGMERLKLICERKLSRAHVDVNTVCSTLEFADQNSCQQLKNCCLAYMVKDRERLKSIVKTKGFEQLDHNCHPMLSEILLRSLHTD